MKNINKLNQSRSSRMKTLPMKPMNDKSFGTTNTIVSMSYGQSLIQSLKDMAYLIRLQMWIHSWRNIDFREFPGVGPSRSGGKWLYLSQLISPSSQDIWPRTGIDAFLLDYVFYTDNEQEVALIRSGPYFKVDFAATFNKSYEDWSKEFGDKFYFT